MLSLHQIEVFAMPQMLPSCCQLELDLPLTSVGTTLVQGKKSLTWSRIKSPHEPDLTLNFRSWKVLVFSVSFLDKLYCVFPLGHNLWLLMVLLGHFTFVGQSVYQVVGRLYKFASGSCTGLIFLVRGRGSCPEELNLLLHSWTETRIYLFVSIFF